MFSPGQLKTLFITPMIGGTVSTVSSGTLLMMILRSDLKLSLPPRRIMFGLCFYDCIFSIGAALSSIPVPKDEGIWGAIGNITTCDIHGFLNHVGIIGSNCYNCTLSIYYFCIIRLSMTEGTFAKKVEPFCHLIPNLYGVGGALYLVSHGYFNNIGNSCWIGPSPINCVTDSEVECLRGEDAYGMRWIFMGYSLYLIWFIIIVTMASIVHLVVKQRKSADRWATGAVGNQNLCPSFTCKPWRLFARPSCKDTSKEIAETAVTTTPISQSDFRVVQGQTDPLEFNLRAMRAQTKRKSMIAVKENPASVAASGAVLKLRSDSYPNTKHGTRPPPLLDLEGESKSDGNDTISEARRLRSISESRSTLSTRGPYASGTISFGSDDDPSAPKTRGHSLENAERAVAIQALLYIFSFFLCFVWSMIMRILENNGKTIPFALYFTARLMLPLQGPFTILIYARPFVLSLRRSHPEYSLWKAFRITVANGGDNRNKNDRPGNSNVSKKIRDRIEQSNKERLQSIRQARRVSMFNSSTASSTTRISDNRQISFRSSLPKVYDDSKEIDLLKIEASFLVNSQDDTNVTNTVEPNAPDSILSDKDSPKNECIGIKNNNDVARVEDLETSKHSNVGTDSIEVDSLHLHGADSSTPENRAPRLPICPTDE